MSTAAHSPPILDAQPPVTMDLELVPRLTVEMNRSVQHESSADAGSTLLLRLLNEQRQLTAVEAFANSDLHAATHSRPAMYRALLPASQPGPGQQYAFDVDLDHCSGCKACVTACHSLN